MIKIQKLPGNETNQFNKPQQKAGANTSIILGHFQKRLTNFFILHSAAFFASIIFQFSFFKKGDMLIQDHSKGGELIQ